MAEEKDYKAPLSGGSMEDSKAYRRFVAISSVDQTDNRAAWNSEMNDALAALKSQESHGVADREEPLPLLPKIIRKVGSLLLTVGVLWLLGYLLLCSLGFWSNGIPPVFLLGIPSGMIASGIIILVIMKIYTSNRDRNAWIERMREQELEKTRKNQ